MQVPSPSTSGAGIGCALISTQRCSRFPAVPGNISFIGLPRRKARRKRCLFVGSGFPVIDAYLPFFRPQATELTGIEFFETGAQQGAGALVGNEFALLS